MGEGLRKSLEIKTGNLLKCVLFKYRKICRENTK